MFNSLLILLFFHVSYPVQEGGRIRPVEIAASPHACVPTDETWLTLEALPATNVSLYSDSLYAELKQGDTAPLHDAYKTLAGKTYRKAHGKQLTYPTYGQLSAELFLTRIPLPQIALAGYLLALLLWKRGRWVFVAAFAVHTLALALRIYILGRPPVATMAETILYVPWIIALCGLLFNLIGPAALAASVLLFFLPMIPDLTTVQAVLDSNTWLLIHVLMIVGSYGLFFFCGALAHLFLLRPTPLLERRLLQTMYLGTGLLICGTILGGVWAAQSWGRFWDWDPKEAWAFISAGTYVLWIHAYKFHKIGGRGLAMGAIVGLMVITFTWYGVNYLLGTGLHSYGFGNGKVTWYLLYLSLEIGFLITQKLLYKKRCIEKKEPIR